MKNRRIVILIASLIVVIVGSQSLYIVSESQQAIITQFGKPLDGIVSDPGLHIKVPFTQKANFFEKRFLEWDGVPNQIPTKDKKYIQVDTYARWQITDPLQFFKRLKDEARAISRLSDILDGETRNFVANHALEETVRSTNRPIVKDSSIVTISDSLRVITVGREKLQSLILATANKQAEELGIEILDFRFKRINYEPKTRETVYGRMRSEREKVASRFRAEGQGEASRISGEKVRKLKEIQSEAFKTSEQIKGEADAKAASIYSSAYNQSSQSRKLYAFLKSMETIEATTGDGTSAILTTDSDLYRYLKKMD